MDLYLESVLNTPEHRALSEAKVRAELAHYAAKAEVDRVQLLVRVVEATAAV